MTAEELQKTLAEEWAAQPTINPGLKPVRSVAQSSLHIVESRTA
jgi:hypothetical protein